MLVICSVTDSLNTNYYRTTFGGMPGSFNFSQINAYIVGIGVLGPQFIVSSEVLGLHKMLSPRGFEHCSVYRACLLDEMLNLGWKSKVRLCWLVKQIAFQLISFRKQCEEFCATCLSRTDLTFRWAKDKNIQSSSITFKM